MEIYFIGVVIENQPASGDQKDRPGVWVQVKPAWDIKNKNAVWARVVQPLASKGSGVVHVPEKDDEVVVIGGTVTGGDPLVIGSVYGAKHLPPKIQAADGVQATHTSLVTPNGMEVTVDDTKDKETIYLRARGDKDGTPDKDLVSIKLDKKNGVLTIVSGETMVTAKEKNVEVVAEKGDVVITTKKGKITIEAKGDLTVDSKGKVTINGASGVDIC